MHCAITGAARRRVSGRHLTSRRGGATVRVRGGGLDDPLIPFHGERVIHLDSGSAFLRRNRHHCVRFFVAEIDRDYFNLHRLREHVGAFSQVVQNGLPDGILILRCFGTSGQQHEEE